MPQPENLSLEITKCLGELAKTGQLAICDGKTPANRPAHVAEVERIGAASFDVCFYACDDENEQDYEDVYKISVERISIDKIGG